MRWLLGLVALSVWGCGSSSSDDDAAVAGSSGNGGSGASGGSAMTGGASGNGTGGSGIGGKGTGGSDTGGSSGSAGAAGYGAGGSGTGACTGVFREPHAVLTSDAGLGSLMLSADELELIYQSYALDDGITHFRRSVRASTDVAFTEGELLEPFEGLCEDSTLSLSGDLSADGLRLYFVCGAVGGQPTPIRVARRTAPGAPFSLDADTLGDAQTGLALDTGERKIVTSPDMTGGTLLVRERASTSAPFGEANPLVGLDGLITPDLSDDGQFLYASTYTTDSRRTLVEAERNGPRAFEPAVPIATFDAPVYLVSSPAISSDCRSLYFVQSVSDGGDSVMVMGR